MRFTASIFLVCFELASQLISRSRTVLEAESLVDDFESSEWQPLRVWLFEGLWVVLVRSYQRTSSVLSFLYDFPCFVFRFFLLHSSRFFLL